jgi:hypothetical protein
MRCQSLLLCEHTATDIVLILRSECSNAFLAPIFAEVTNTVSVQAEADLKLANEKCHELAMNSDQSSQQVSRMKLEMEAMRIST